MVAGILEQLGIDMGPCKPPDLANPLGYFEDIRFWWMHRSWSRRYETDSARLRLRLPSWNPALSAVDLRRYDRLIRTCEQRPCWGVKDPELCYYASTFAATLRQPFRVIATTRNLNDVIQSLDYVRRSSSANNTMIAHDYVRRQTSAIEELEAHGIAPTMRIDYDAALDDPDAMVQRIAEHVGLPVTEAAASFISPELRRHGQEQPGNTLRNDDQGVTTSTT
jgi:hypothetical protein